MLRRSGYFILRSRAAPQLEVGSPAYLARARRARTPSDASESASRKALQSPATEDTFDA